MVGLELRVGKAGFKNRGYHICVYITLSMTDEVGWRLGPWVDIVHNIWIIQRPADIVDGGLFALKQVSYAIF